MVLIKNLPSPKPGGHIVIQVADRSTNQPLLPHKLFDKDDGNISTHDRLGDFSGMNGCDTPKDSVEGDIESEVRGTLSGTQQVTTGDLEKTLK